MNTGVSIYAQKSGMAKEKGIIIGNNSDHGLEFIQLALKDYDEVLLAGKENHFTENIQEKREVGVIDQDLGAEDMAQHLIEELEFFESLGTDAPLTLVVNLIEFNVHDPWEEGQPANPSINISQLLELNDFFTKKMVLQGQGEIMNVISRPADCPDHITEMFLQTQALLMEMAETFNQDLEQKGVHVHTLSYSPQSFSLQSKNIPAMVAHDMTPRSCSARDIADYGYQVLRMGAAH